LARIEKMSRVYPKPILEQLIYMPALTLEMLANHQQVAEWVDELNERFVNALSGAAVYQIFVTEDTERHVWLPRIQMTAHGLNTDYILSYTFFDSQEYAAVVELGSTLQGLIEDGAFVQRNDKKREVGSFEEVIAWLMNEARRGYQIQRYKGLGEMNPGQLWETTMDPQARRMLKVTIEDAIAADQIFTTLMGDDVEPRRAFIEANALSVANLDY
jgi:DNA gyrase subunit B